MAELAGTKNYVALLQSGFTIFMPVASSDVLRGGLEGAKLKGLFKLTKYCKTVVFSYPVLWFAARLCLWLSWWNRTHQKFQFE